MLKYSAVFFCLFLFSCATQFEKYTAQTNKKKVSSDAAVNSIEIYNKNKAKVLLNALNSGRIKIANNIKLDEPLVFSAPAMLTDVQSNNRKLADGYFRLLLPELKNIRLSKSINSEINSAVGRNEELMLARANEEIKNLKTTIQYIKPPEKKKEQHRAVRSNVYSANSSAGTSVKKKTNTNGVQTRVSAEPVKSIISRLTDTIIISFKGRGWVYAGMAELSAPADGIKYKGKNYNNNKTSFTFKAHKIGDYRLKFVKQDNNSATSINKNVKVQVVQDSDFSRLLTEGNNSGRLENTKEERDYTVPDNLYKSGNYSEALKEYLRIYNSSSPYLNDRIALLYFKEQEYDAAFKYWKQNLQPVNKYYRQALVGTMLCAAKLDNIVEVSKNIENYKNILDKSKSLKEEKNLFNIAQVLYQKNRTKFAIELLNAYIKNYSGGRYIDAVYFYLGDIYERDRRIRDLKKSLSFYEKVYNDYTGSAYYNRAYGRIDYIKRHFFDIR